jgi:hypothetical protein
MEVVSGKEKLRTCSMVKASPFAAFAGGASAVFAADDFDAGAFCADDCAGADFAGVCALAADDISMAAAKQAVPTAE